MWVLIILAVVFIIRGVVLYFRKLRRKRQEGLFKARVPGDVYEYGCSPTAAQKIARGLERGGKYPEFSSKDD